MAQSRDLQQARKLIGTTLLVLLIAIVLLGFGALFQMQPRIDGTAIAAVHNQEDAERLEIVARIASEQSKAEAERLSLLLNIVFGPVVTLLGSVTGFYFGSKTARRAD